MEALQKIEKPGLVLKEGLDSLMSGFLLAQDVSAKSKESYKRALRQFFKYAAENCLVNFSRLDILEYKNHLVNREYSAYTVTHYITSVRKFFEWTESEKIYPNIAKSVKGAKQPKGFRKESLTVEQVKRVLNSVDRSTLQGKRDFSLLRLLITTGLRTIELVRADIFDLVQEGGEAILYIQGKGRQSKDDFVLLPEETLNPIREYLTARKTISEKEPLFVSMSDRNNGQRLTTRSISRMVKNYLIGAGLDSIKLSAHSFRHTAVTLSLLGGASLQEAQTMARHANINTTLVYAHNIDRVKNAAERKIDALLV